MFTHKCELCGMEFQSKSNRAKYCTYCRDKAQVNCNRAYAEKKKSSTSVPLGSEQICLICNKPYIVASGSQKYCKDCTKKAVKKKSPDAEYIRKITIISVLMSPKARAMPSRLMLRNAV